MNNDTGPQQTSPPFEARVLECVDTLYEVALKLTDTPENARALTRHVLATAFLHRQSLQADPHLKSRLLTLLRAAHRLNSANGSLHRLSAVGPPLDLGIRTPSAFWEYRP